MIESFKHKGLSNFFTYGVSSKINPEHKNRIKLILTMLNAAEEVYDMNFPGSDLHRLKGNLKEYWSVNVSKNWNIIFKFRNNNAYDVDYLDYH